MTNLVTKCSILCGMLIAGSFFRANAQFDNNGNIAASLRGQLLFAKDNLALKDQKKTLDSIDWRVKGAPSPLDKTVSRKGVNELLVSRTGFTPLKKGFRVVWDCSVPETAKGNSIHLSVQIPAEIWAELPEQRGTIRRFGADRKAVVETGCFRYLFDLSGSSVNFQVAQIEDFRFADWLKRFRLTLATEPLKLRNAKISVEVTCDINPEIYTEKSSQMFFHVPVAENGNRSLSDQVENDGKGGWTDQGTDDMSVLKPGQIIAQGIPFRIGGKAIILRGKHRQSFPEKSTVFPLGIKVERLAFCHTSAWNAQREVAFFYRIVYQNGKTVDVPVIGGLDVGDWVTLLPTFCRVRTAWKGDNGQHTVSLAHMQWRNPHPEIPIKSVQVLSGKKMAVGIVLAITAVRQEKTPPELLRYLNEEYKSSGKMEELLPEHKVDWYECRIPADRRIEPGSALDASFVNHAPAGKYGFLKRVGDHFEFEKRPGVRAVFWGTCFGSAPEKQYAPLYAEALARAGINILRIHGWSNQFKHPGYPEEIKRSFTLPGEKVNYKTLDDYHYFFAELIKRGIYIYMDTITAGNWFSKPGNPKWEPEYREKCKKMAEVMYLSRNPYTGKRLVDDPAFAMCEIINESTCTYGGDIRNERPAVRKIMEGKWEKWQKMRGILPLQPLRGTPMEGNGKEGRRFFSAEQKAFLEEMYHFLRKIGVKVPICGTNLELTAGDLWASQNMDFMNDHAYWGAQPAPNSFWYPKNQSLVKQPLSSGTGFLGEIVHSRLHDKPIVCSEWSAVYPNVYRQEAYPFVAAFAAYQNFDAMLSFDWSGAYLPNLKHVIKTHRIVCLSQMADPSTFGLNQPAVIARMRGDIQPARKHVILKYSEDDIWSNRRQIPQTVSFLFQMARVSIKLPEPGAKNEWPLGTGKTREDLFHDAVKRLDIQSGRDYVVSDTGELIRFADPALFLVDTPKSQFATGVLSSLGSGERRRLSAFEILSSMRFATLTFSSLDNLPLKRSRRILCCAVGNSANAKTRINANDFKESQEGPVLTEPFYAVVSADNVPGTHLKVYKLNPDTGKRIGTLNTVFKQGKETFIIDKNAKTMYFELIRE